MDGAGTAEAPTASASSLLPSERQPNPGWPQAGTRQQYQQHPAPHDQQPWQSQQQQYNSYPAHHDRHQSAPAAGAGAGYQQQHLQSANDYSPRTAGLLAHSNNYANSHAYNQLPGFGSSADANQRRWRSTQPQQQSVGDSSTDARDEIAANSGYAKQKKKQVDVKVADCVTMHLNKYFKAGRIATKDEFKHLSRKASKLFVQSKGGYAAFDLANTTALDELKNEIEVYIDRGWFSQDVDQRGGEYPYAAPSVAIGSRHGQQMQQMQQQQMQQQHNFHADAVAGGGPAVFRGNSGIDSNSITGRILSGGSGYGGYGGAGAAHTAGGTSFGHHSLGNGDHVGTAGGPFGSRAPAHSQAMHAAPYSQQRSQHHHTNANAGLQPAHRVEALATTSPPNAARTAHLGELLLKSSTTANPLQPRDKGSIDPKKMETSRIVAELQKLSRMPASMLARVPDKGAKFKARKAALEAEVAARKVAATAAAAAAAVAAAAAAAAAELARPPSDPRPGAARRRIVEEHRTIATPPPHHQQNAATPASTATAAATTTTAATSVRTKKRSSSASSADPESAAAPHVIKKRRRSHGDADRAAVSGGGRGRGRPKKVVGAAGTSSETKEKKKKKKLSRSPLPHAKSAADQRASAATAPTSPDSPESGTTPPSHQEGRYPQRAAATTARAAIKNDFMASLGLAELSTADAVQAKLHAESVQIVEALFPGGIDFDGLVDDTYADDDVDAIDLDSILSASATPSSLSIFLVVSKLKTAMHELGEKLQKSEGKVKQQKKVAEAAKRELLAAEQHAREQAKKAKEETAAVARDRAKVDSIRKLSQAVLAGEENLQLVEQRCVALVVERDEAQDRADKAGELNKRQEAAIGLLKELARAAGADLAEINAAANVD